MSLFRAKTVQQRALLPREVETWLPSSAETTVAEGGRNLVVVRAAYCDRWCRDVVGRSIVGCPSVNQRTQCTSNGS